MLFYEYEWIGKGGNYVNEYYGGYGNVPSHPSYVSTYLFTNQTWTQPEPVQFILKNCYPSYTGEDYSYLSRYTFQLSTVSESYYLYMKSKVLQAEQDDFLGEAGLREPIPTYSNVKGGYGLVGGKQTDTYDLILTEGDRPPSYNPFDDRREEEEPEDL